MRKPLPAPADPATLGPETPGGRFAKSAEEAAKIIGVTAATVRYWIRQGCPPKRNGRYDIEAMLAWRGPIPATHMYRMPQEGPPVAPGTVDPASANQLVPGGNIAAQRQEWALRKERAVAMQQELELAKLEGTLIEAEVPAREYAAHITTARTLLEQLPDAILALLPSLTGPTRKSVRKRIGLKIEDIIRAMRGDLEER